MYEKSMLKEKGPLACRGFLHVHTFKKSYANAKGQQPSSKLCAKTTKVKFSSILYAWNVKKDPTLKKKCQLLELIIAYTHPKSPRPMQKVRNLVDNFVM